LSTDRKAQAQQRSGSHQTKERDRLPGCDHELGVDLSWPPRRTRPCQDGTDLESRQVQELLPGIATLLHGGIIDVKEGVAH